MNEGTKEGRNVGRCVLGLTSDTELLGPALARVVHVVNREADSGLVETLIVVYLPKEHRRGRGLPLVKMDDVRLPAGSREELQAGPAKVEVGLGLVVAPGVDPSPPEDVASIPIGPEKDELDSLAGRGVNLSLELAHLKASVPLVALGAPVLELEAQIRQEGLVDALVEGQDDLDVVPPRGA